MTDAAAGSPAADGPPPIEIAAAIVADASGRVLVGRRPAGTHLGGRCEFPGGKLRPGESAEAACRRECLEEIGAEVIVLRPAARRFLHRYPDRTVALSFFDCVLAPGSPAPRPLGTLELQWVPPEALPSLDWPAANRALVARIAARR